MRYSYNVITNNKYLLLIVMTLLILLNRSITFTPLGIIFSYSQLFFILVLLYSKRSIDAIYLHLIFSLTSLEFTLSTDISLFSFRTVRIAGFSTFTLSLIMLYVYHFNAARYFLRSSNKVRFLLAPLIYGSFIGIIGILNFDYQFSFIFAEFKYWLLLFLSAHLFHIKIIQQGEGIKIFKRITIYFFCINTLVNFLAGAFDVVIDNYGGVDVFVFDSADILTPFILMLYSKSNSKKRNTMIIITFIIFLMNIYFYAASGKSILIAAFVLLMFFYKNYIRNTKISPGKIIFIPITFILSVFLITKNQSGKMFENKLGDSIAVLSLNWITNPMDLSASPRDRVFELMNISSYLSSRPLLLLFGVGFGGYYEEDYIVNYTANANGGYSDYEIKTRKFINPHVSINRILLKFGLIGLLIWIYTIYDIIKSRSYDEYSKYILLILLLLFIGYSLKIALMIGLFLNFYKVRKINFSL